MTTLKAGEPSIVRTAVALLATVYAATFVVAVLLHVGVDIPLGLVVLDEPRRPFAVIVEGVAGIVLAAGAFAVFAGTTRAWAAVTGAHAVALAGVLWGMVAVAAGRGPHTQLNDTYHRVMVVLLGATLILLLTPLGRNALGRERNRSPGTAAAPNPGSSGAPSQPGPSTPSKGSGRRSESKAFGSGLGDPTTRNRPPTGQRRATSSQSNR